MAAPQAPAKNPGQPTGQDPEALKDLWHYNLTNHKPTADGIRRIEALRSAAMAMADALIDLTPAGRDQAMALSANEEMLFHANAAVARAMNEDIEKTPDEDVAAPAPDAAGSDDQASSTEGQAS
jgi:hypothetical protein